MNFRDLLLQVCADHIQPSPVQLDALEHHCQLLVRWNQTLNLTRVESLEEIVRLHFFESLFLASLLPSGPLRLADLGSGAGFPGVPVAALRPESGVLLIESHQRKAVFLREAARVLSNATIFAGRAEDLRQHFDWIVSRAVNPSLVLSISARFAPRVALLSSLKELERLPKPEHVQPVPGTANRVVAVFHVEHVNLERDKIDKRG